MGTCNSSMQLTRGADYGVRVMIHLAGLARHRRCPLSALSRATSAPESFLSKVLQALVRSGFIASHRGQGGGFELTPLGRDASVRQVIEAVDGPLYLNLCLDPTRTCPRKSWCPVHPVWARAQHAMLEELEAALIENLATCPSFVRIEQAS
jgi:Rrf2 family protein